MHLPAATARVAAIVGTLVGLLALPPAGEDRP